MDLNWITIGLSVYATIAVVVMLSVISGLKGKGVYVVPLLLVAIFWPVWLVIWLLSFVPKKKNARVA